MPPQPQMTFVLNERASLSEGLTTKIEDEQVPGTSILKWQENLAKSFERLS